MYLERRALPRASKITYKRQVEMDQKLHRARLKTIKPSIDNKPPKRHAHLRRNLKREQMMEERFATIERENRILLSKMSDIMQKNTLDNINDSMQYSHSLNKAYRKRELQRITAENQAILRRIQQREPVYNHFQWEEERIANEKYLSNIQEYPSQMMPSKMGTRSGMGPLMLEGDEEGELEPLDSEYARDSRERARTGATGGAGGPRYDEPAGRLEPMAPAGHSRGAGSPLSKRAGAGPESDRRSRSPDGVGATGSAVHEIRARSREGDRGGVESRGDITRGTDAGDVAEATLFSVGRKMGEDYYMVSQSHAGEITLYNPFSSETHPLHLPRGWSTPASMDEFRKVVNHLQRTDDGGFTLAAEPTI